MATTLSRLKLDEISLVDSPANKGARVVLVKRSRPLAEAVVELAKRFDFGDQEQSVQFSDALAEELRQRKQFEVEDQMMPLISALRESMVTAATDLEGEAREVQMRVNADQFVQSVNAVLKASDMSADEKTRMQELMNGGMDEADARAQALRELRKQNPGGDDMTPEEMKAKIDELTKRLEEVEGARDVAVKMHEAVEKAVTEAGFTVKVADDGAVQVAKAAEPEYVEFNGERIQKDQVPASVLKAIEDGNAKLAKLESEREAEKLAKRAETELPNLAGTPEHKGGLLKALEGLDEEPRKAVMESLKAADAAVGKLFESVGKQPDDDGSSATAQLRKLATEYATQHNVSFETAFADVTKSGEGRDLLKQSRTESN